MFFTLDSSLAVLSGPCLTLQQHLKIFEGYNQKLKVIFSVSMMEWKTDSYLKLYTYRIHPDFPFFSNLITFQL